MSGLGDCKREEREGGVTNPANQPTSSSLTPVSSSIIHQVALPSWIEVCIAAEEALSTKAFQPTQEPQAAAPILAPINGRRKSAAPRPLTGKRSLEPIKDQASHVPSPSHECFSSSQLEVKNLSGHQHLHPFVVDTTHGRTTQPPTNNVPTHTQAKATRCA